MHFLLPIFDSKNPFIQRIAEDNAVDVHLLLLPNTMHPVYGLRKFPWCP